MNRLIYAAVILILLLSIRCSGNRFSPLGGVKTPENLMNYVDGSRYAADLSTISVERFPGTPGHHMVQQLCARRLSELGFKVELDSYGTGVNVIGQIDGTGKPEETVILSAHYDSRYAGCPGADDNASGVAGVLEAARVLVKARYDRTLIIALWDEEEQRSLGSRGLFGSRAFAAKARLEGRKIVLAMVFEMIGYRSTEPGSQKFPARMKSMFPDVMKRVEENQNRGDFICITVNEKAKQYSDIYSAYADSIALPSITLKIGCKLNKLHDFRRSDHAAFWEKGYSAMMIGDTINFRNGNYHCHDGKVDDVSTLDMAFGRDTVTAAVATMARILEIRQ